MENFDWTSFTVKIAVKTDMSVIYKAWTQAEEIEKWFLKGAKYISTENAERDRNSFIQAGDQYEWSWFLFDGVGNGRITAANGKDHLQFTFAGECPVDVNLKQDGENVIVELRQSEIPTDDASKRGIRLGCEKGWSFFLFNLKSIYEGGIDLRNQDENLKGMLNN